MNLKADIVKALRVSLDREDSEHLAAEIMDRLPPVYAAAPEMLAMAKRNLHELRLCAPGKKRQDSADIQGAIELTTQAIRKAKGEKP